MIPRGFTVVRLAINRPIPDSAFVLPPIPDGVFIDDQINLGKSGPKGGRIAGVRYRERYEPKTSPEDSKPNRPPAPALRANPDPPRTPWGPILAAVAGCFLLASAIAWWLQRREDSR
jgi:hypothetical protein